MNPGTVVSGERHGGRYSIHEGEESNIECVRAKIDWFTSPNICS